LTAACCTVSLTTPACILPPVPTTDEIVRGLSDLVLKPEVTCEEMRRDNGIWHLAPVANPAEAGVYYEEYFVPTPSGETLQVWYLPADPERGVVILSHGNAGTMACYLYSGLLLVQSGWTVVTYDYEGYGRSSGSPDFEAIVGDLDAVLDWTLATTGRDTVTLYGISLGSIPSIAVAAERPDVVNGVVLDSPVALRSEFERFAWLLAGRPERFLCKLDARLVTEDTIEALDKPLLVFVGSRDDITPPATIQRLYDRAPWPKFLVSFPGVDHGMGPYFATEEYMAYLLGFLEIVHAEGG